MGLSTAVLLRSSEPLPMLLLLPGSLLHSSPAWMMGGFRIQQKLPDLRGASPGHSQFGLGPLFCVPCINNLGFPLDMSFMKVGMCLSCSL